MLTFYVVSVKPSEGWITVSTGWLALSLCSGTNHICSLEGVLFGVFPSSVFPSSACTYRYQPHLLSTKLGLEALQLQLFLVPVPILS